MIQGIIDSKIRNATATIHIFSLTLSTKEQELVQEKQKMDDLLFLTLPLQVLKDSSWSYKPKSLHTLFTFLQIAKDIQSKKRIKAINIENVSILFR